MRGGREHPAGGKVPAWALAGLGSSASRRPKPVRGQTDIFDALEVVAHETRMDGLKGQTGIFAALGPAEPRLRADGQLEGQTDIFDVLKEVGGDG